MDTVSKEQRDAVEAFKKRRKENEGKWILSNDSVLYLYCRHCYALIDTISADTPRTRLTHPRSCCSDCHAMKEKGWLF